MTPNTPPSASHWPPGRNAIPHLLFLLFAALVIYQPWASVPFPMVDYSEFLRPFQQGRSFFAGLGNVIDYYQSHGRSSYLAYAQLGLNWLLFDEHPVGWNVSVFGYMALAMAGVWLLLIRLGHTPLIATMAAALCMVATPDVDVWWRPTGEPLVVLFMCLALMIALSYQRAEHWRLRAAALLMLFLGIGLAKDLLTPLLFFPFAVALGWNEGAARIPRASARNLTLIIGTALVAATLAFFILHALTHRAAGAYTEGYSLTNVSPLESIGIFWTTLLPYSRAMTGEHISTAQAVANGLFVILLVIGLAVMLRRAGRAAPRARTELNFWLALLLCGALLYSPLRWFSPFYAVPFALGSIALFARALSALETRARPFRAIVRVITGFILMAGAVSAWNAARRETATRRIHGDVAHAIGQVSGIDSLVVAWYAVDEWEWAQQSAVIRRYAITLGELTDSAPPAGDALCGTVRPGTASAGRRIVLINYPELCGDLPFPASELNETYLTFSPLPERRQMRLQVAVVTPDSAFPPLLK